MKSLLFYLFLLSPFFGLELYAFDSAVPDSLVFEDELVFESDFEKAAYYELLKGNEKAFETLMSIGRQPDAKMVGMDKSMVEREINVLKQIPVPKKKKGKYIRTLYTQVHDRFLKKYELQNYFYEVFENGNYNCVSACAIYAMVFQEMDIPFYVKETPSHVYLIVEYGGEKILIETTDPIDGYSKFSSSFKSSFVTLLAQSKLISDSEYSSNQAEALFDKYYFTKENLGLKELVAFQYSNHGIYLTEESDFTEAINTFSKSYVLYPSEKTAEMMLYAIGRQLSVDKHQDMQSAKLLCMASRYDSDVIPDADLRNEFLRINNDILVDQGNTALYDSTFSFIKENMRRKELFKEINYMYHYERGRILYNRGKYETALPFLESAFALKPNNSDIESIFLSCLGQSLAKKNDTKGLINRLKYLLEKFSVLKENNLFGGIFLNAHLIEMADSYNARNFSQGEYHKGVFEQTIDENPGYTIEEDLVGRAYSQLAVYYFRKGQYTNAKKAINVGLKYAPGNYELLNRKRMISY